MKSQLFSFPCAMLLAGLVVTCGLLVSGDTAQAASVTWTEVVVDSTDDSPTNSPGTGLGDAAVSTIGMLVEAANFGVLTDHTVNGVPFNGVNFTAGNLPTNLSIAYDGADNTFTGFTGTSTGGVIDLVTKSFSRDAGVTVQNATLTGLTVGNQYLVQFIASFATINRTNKFDDLNGNTITQKTNNPHSFSTGTFTADATTQAVKMTSSASNHTQFLSAYQLREIPEPTGLALGAIGVVGILAAARRRS
jgi:hypothetical protein